MLLNVLPGMSGLLDINEFPGFAGPPQKDRGALSGFAATGRRVYSAEATGSGKLSGFPCLHKASVVLKHTKNAPSANLCSDAGLKASFPCE